MNLIKGNKELLKIVRWAAGEDFMHNLTYLQIINVFHFEEVNPAQVTMKNFTSRETIGIMQPKI